MSDSGIRAKVFSYHCRTGDRKKDEAVQAEENLLCQSAKMTLLERGYSSWQYFCTNGELPTDVIAFCVGKKREQHEEVIFNSVLRNVYVRLFLYS